MDVMEIKQKIDGKDELLEKEVSKESENMMNEIRRLHFVLDKSNRFPGLLSSNETLKLSRKLADLERRVHLAGR